MIGIIDYGAGNLGSVNKAFRYIGAPCRIIHRQEDLRGVARLVLPGVGAFQSAVEGLRDKGLYEETREWLGSKKPFLGICLGMQVLFSTSEESQSSVGFGIFEGVVTRFAPIQNDVGQQNPNQLKVPQIGWNQVHVVERSSLFAHIPDDSYFYFLHSYYVPLVDGGIVRGTTDYGVVYTSVIEHGNIHAVQFHPEKSGKNGMQLLKNWIALC